jgi:predicted membrane channel-forming protein YqfA (hemolysin III family)
MPMGIGAIVAAIALLVAFVAIVIQDPMGSLLLFGLYVGIPVLVFLLSMLLGPRNKKKGPPADAGDPTQPKNVREG